MLGGFKHNDDEKLKKHKEGVFSLQKEGVLKHNGEATLKKHKEGGFSLCRRACFGVLKHNN